MASHDYPTDFPVGLPLTDTETPRAFLPGATTPSARQLPPVGLPLQAGRGPFLENEMTTTYVDYSDAMALWVHTFDGHVYVSAPASDLIFNHDWSDCRDDKGNWNVEAMHEEAKHVAWCLSQLGEAINHLGVLSELFRRM